MVRDSRAPEFDPGFRRSSFGEPARESDASGEQAALARSNLVVELSKEAQAEQPINAEPLRQIMRVDAKIGGFEPQARKPRNANEVARLASDSGANDGRRLSLPGRVPELVEVFGRDDRFRRAGVDSELKLCELAARPPDSAGYHDELKRWIEAGDSQMVGPKSGPVKKQPTVS